MSGINFARTRWGLEPAGNRIGTTSVAQKLQSFVICLCLLCYFLLLTSALVMITHFLKVNFAN